jgi:hypothetical protein
MRIAGALTILAVATLTRATAVASSSRRVPVVPCDDVIAWSKSGDDGGWRIVLGVVSVSAAHLRQVVATHIRPWAYWRKAGLSVHAGQGPVSASVATAWRSRVAITWGNNVGPVSSLRIARCTVQWPGKAWNGYAGGFFLRSRSACVPLSVRVAERSRIVRFGIGRKCRAGG